MKKLFLFFVLLLGMAAPAMADPLTPEQFAALPDAQKYEFYIALYNIEAAVPVITLPETVVTFEKNGSVGVSYSGPVTVKIDYLEYDITLYPKVIAANRVPKQWGWTVGGVVISFSVGLAVGGIIGGIIGHAL